MNEETKRLLFKSLTEILYQRQVISKEKYTKMINEFE